MEAIPAGYMAILGGFFNGVGIRGQAFKVRNAGSFLWFVAINTGPFDFRKFCRFFAH